MLVDPEITPPPIEKQRPPRWPPHWQSLLRVWRRRIRRKSTLIISVITVPLVALLIAGGWFYIHYSHLIDAQLAGGAFRDSVNIYGAPIVFTDGDALNASQVEAQLALAGIKFSESSKGIDVGPVRIVLAGNREIQRIEQSGRDVKTWTAGYPLLENLSPGREKRRMVTFADLPPTLVNAVVSVEDKHFFHHRGLDLPRIAKAAYVDFRDGRKAQGASTLTMQLVRGLWLQPDKRWKRKVAEAMMTVHLERKWSKEEIMAAYANEVFLGTEAGYSIHGFAEGSKLFFGKEMRNLTLAEAALLAGMVQRPSYFNPYRNPERAKDRRDLVLNLMRDNKYVTAAEYRDAIDTPREARRTGAAKKTRWARRGFSIWSAMSCSPSISRTTALRTSIQPSTSICREPPVKRSPPA